MNLIIYYFLLFSISIQSKKAYNSETIGEEKPIITRDHIFFNNSNKIMAKSLDNLSKSHSMFGNFIENLCYIHQPIDGEIMFFSQKTVD